MRPQLTTTQIRALNRAKPGTRKDATSALVRRQATLASVLAILIVVGIFA